MFTTIRTKLADFLHWHAVDPISHQVSETLYQGIFAQQCKNLGIRNDFYPVGAAANYTLLYLLARVLTELEVSSIVEFGSGQSSILIDRVKKPVASHVCVEHDEGWHSILQPRLLHCEYLRCPLMPDEHDGVMYDFYSSVPDRRFELMLVDGPPGVPRFSRFGCVKYALRNLGPDFLIIIDDFDRIGEKDTATRLFNHLKTRQPSTKMRELRAVRSQAVIAGGRFLQALYYW